MPGVPVTRMSASQAAAQAETAARARLVAGGPRGRRYRDRRAAASGTAAVVAATAGDETRKSLTGRLAGRPILSFGPLLLLLGHS